MNEFTELRASNYEQYRWLCDDLFAKWIVNKISPYGKTILDVGCGNGFMFRYYRGAFSDISAIEPSEFFYVDLIKKHGKHITLKKAYAEDIPFEDKSVDIAIAKSSLHHFNNSKQGLDEMRRVAKKMVAVIEVVTPSLNTLKFMAEILPKKEKGRKKKTIYTANSLKRELLSSFSDKRIFQLLYDQYINVDIWLKYSDLEEIEKESIYRKINESSDLIKDELHIRQYNNSLVMLRRMCLSLIELQ